MSSEQINQRLEKLPKWAKQHIANLERRVKSAEATLPWTEKGMEWFTLFHPRTQRERKSIGLFTLSEEGANCICSVGPDDCIFVGRGKKARQP